MSKSELDFTLPEFTKDFLKWKVEWIESEFIDVLESLQSLPEDVREALKQRLHSYLDDPFSKILQCHEEEITFQKANPRKLYVTTYSGNSYVIDIIKSLHNDPLNITHPLIVYALEMLVRAPEWQYLFFAGPPPVYADAAQYCLKRIFQTIELISKRRSLELMKEFIVFQRAIHESFFKEFVKVIQSPEITKISNIVKKKRLIEEALRPLFERFPAIKLVPIMQFINSLNNQYPKNWRTLCDSYAEWCFKISRRKSLSKDTIKQYIFHTIHNQSLTLEKSGLALEQAMKRRNDVLRRPGASKRIIHSDLEITESALAWEESGKG